MRTLSSMTLMMSWKRVNSSLKDIMALTQTQTKKTKCSRCAPH